MKEKKKEFPVLNRPIIMICNDAFGRNLFPLREITLKLKVNAAVKDRIVERIGEILKSENIIGVDNQVINQIIE